MKEQPIIVKVLIGVSIVLLSTAIIGLFSSYTAVQFNKTKIKTVEDRLDDVPSNEVLLQYMELTQIKFENQQKLLEEHIKNDHVIFEWHQKQIDRVDAELQKIRDQYLTDRYRSDTEKKK